MALFNAAAILADEVQEKIILIEGFKTQTQSYELNIIIKSDKKIRRKATEAKEKHNSVKYLANFRGNGENNAEIIPTNNPTGYCLDLLPSCFVSSNGDVLDEHSLSTLQGLVERFPAFAKELASKMFEFFESGDVFDTSQMESYKKK